MDRDILSRDSATTDFLHPSPSVSSLVDVNIGLLGPNVFIAVSKRATIVLIRPVLHNHPSSNLALKRHAVVVAAVVGLAVCGRPVKIIFSVCLIAYYSQQLASYMAANHLILVVSWCHRIKRMIY